MKNRASFIKIYIKTEEHKLNFPPIPFFMTTTLISIAKQVVAFAKKNQQDEIDVVEILNDCKHIIKELKKYPPFEIVNVESDKTKVIIKTK